MSDCLNDLTTANFLRDNGMLLIGSLISHWQPDWNLFMDSRPGPVRHCRSCVSYVYVFSKKKLHGGM